MIPYLVCQFSKPTVSNLVKECFGADFPDIFKKTQLNYIFQYLNDLKAVTVLLEREYLDKDYLEDFSRYYVKCFKNGGHKCARLHFFSSQIDHTSFAEILKSGSSSQGYKELSASYLGFVVIKPLHQTFIGKTCLKLYPTINIDGYEKKCLTRDYSVNLFGVDLKVTTTAFQEQDKVVSACATTAIWTALHGSQEKSDKQIPACSEITTNAINHVDGSNNSFPNEGLTNQQILRALDMEGLRYHNIPADKKNASDLFDVVRYHINSKIPLILGVRIDNADPRLSGEHALTILGYAKEDDKKAFYVHDDRLGPFAKALITETNGKPQLALQKRDSTGNWLPPHEYLDPLSLIIPTNKKVRIPYKHPRNTCLLIYEFLNTWASSSEGQKTGFNPDCISHSLQLYGISNIRKHVLDFQYGDHKNIAKLLEEKTKFLTRSYARFQWVASFKYNNTNAFKILFDATDIPQGDAVSGIFVENQEVTEFILGIIKKYAHHVKTEKRNIGESFINSLVNYLKEPAPDYFDYLDKAFGELRAPRYLKESECIDGEISVNNSRKVYYESTTASLKDIFSDIAEDMKLIWAIAGDGALIIGEDKGHPTLTGFKPARIAGELKKKNALWHINSKSGRYSKDYNNAEELLGNALIKFKTIFIADKDALEIDTASLD